MISAVKNQTFVNYDANFSDGDLFVEQLNNLIASIGQEAMEGYQEHRTGEGEFSGFSNGFGRIVVPVGWFIGTLQNGLPYEGTLELVTSTTRGFFNKGKRHGQCQVNMLTEDQIRSKVRADNTLHFSDLVALPRLRAYEGECKDGSFDGEGKMEESRDTWYKGTFKANERHGSGKFVFGKCWQEGEWVEGKFTGKGEAANEEGTIFTGKWKDSVLEGLGNYKTKDGAYYEGFFVKSVAQGKGEYKDVFGTVYKGIFDKGLIHGSGNFTEKNGSFYQGNFDHGLRHGKGKYTIKAGGKITHVYDGNWKDDQFHGIGIHTTGMVSEKGNWVEGKKEGEFEVTLSMTLKLVYKEGEVIK